MHSFSSRLGVLSIAMVLFGCVALAQDAASTKALHDLFDREWEYDLRESPTRASQMGDRRWNERWSDMSLAAIKRRHDHDLEVLANLAKIDRTKLSKPEQLNYDLFKKDVELAIEGFKYRWYLVPLNQRGGIQTENELGDSLRFATVKDY